MNVVVESVTLASIYILFSVGLSLAWGVGKILNLAHGAVFTLAGLVVYEMTKTSSRPLWLLIICAAVAGAAATVVLDIVCFRLIRRRRAFGGRAELGQMVASLGAGVALVAVCQNVSGKTSQALPEGLASQHEFHFWGTHMSVIDIQIVVIALVMSGALALAIRYLSFGRKLRAVAYQPTACEILGINAQGITATAMAISGAMAGVAAALLAAETVAYDQQLGNSYILKAFAIIILGGAGSVSGTIIGGLVLGFAETITATYLSATWVDTASFVLIVVVLLVRPQGLLGTPVATRV